MKIVYALSFMLSAAVYVNAAPHKTLNKTIMSTGDTALNKVAPNFELKDLDGKTVSLADYKGKTLVIDFWATWCGPCRSSFPSVAKVISMYKDDPNVKFLFIATRETADNYKELAKKFMSDNKYPFYVVFDEKSASGKMDSTYKQYVMPGIPTKYFIDSKGIIRYQSVGYNPGLSADEAAEEIKQIIEKVKKA